MFCHASFNSFHHHSRMLTCTCSSAFHLVYTTPLSPQDMRQVVEAMVRREQRKKEARAAAAASFAAASKQFRYKGGVTIEEHDSEDEDAPEPGGCTACRIGVEKFQQPP